MSLAQPNGHKPFVACSPVLDDVQSWLVQTVCVDCGKPKKQTVHLLNSQETMLIVSSSPFSWKKKNALFLGFLFLVAFVSETVVAQPKSGQTTHHFSQEDYAIIENVREDNVKGITQALNGGGDINVIGPGGQTPLMLAVLSGKIESVKLLLEKGADVTIGEKYVYYV